MPVSTVLVRIASASVIATYLSASGVMAASTPDVLYAFRGGADGNNPFARLMLDAHGNLYGTTNGGGNGAGCSFGLGCGTIFRVTPTGKERVLYGFQGGCDGAFPSYAGLVEDDAGNLYGTTEAGGGCKSGGLGTVFKLAADGTETVLYAFANQSDGNGPLGDLLRDSQGNLYGTVSSGGSFAGDCANQSGCGVVFEITADGTEKALHLFAGGSDGLFPWGGLVSDAQGNLYGTTVAGGGGQAAACDGVGCGTVFKLAPDGTETVLYAFQGGSDGGGPIGDLILDKSGNLYGTTPGGGANGKGAVFRVAPDGTETVLYSFKGGTDGIGPRGGVVMDKKGNLYGTTSSGGNTGCKFKFGCGTVFKLTPDGKETILLTFDKTNGGNPYAGLALGKNGMLYGTTSAGGHHNNGVVFQVNK